MGLPRPEMDGARVRVYADELELGSFELRAEQPAVETWDLPQALLAREVLSVRFEADDYVYAADDPRHCIAFRLVGVGLVY